MTIKELIPSGSPRKCGNSGMLRNEFARGASEAYEMGMKVR